MRWDNECLAHAFSSLQPPTSNAPTTFLPFCADWVINTTDKVWLPDRTPNQVMEALHEHFYTDWESTSNGKYYRGMSALEQLVNGTKKAFPDLKIHITDAFCVGNDVDGYKTIMPDVLVGTHTGPSALFGPPTGKVATWSGMALCYVQKVNGRWQYVAEWVVHDELSAGIQLGVDMARVAALGTTVASMHDCVPNFPSWGWQPPIPASALPATAELPALPALPATAAEASEQEAKKASAEAAEEVATKQKHVVSAGYPTPAAKAVVEKMDAMISNHVSTYDWPAWQRGMAPFWADGFTYDSTLGTGVWTGLRAWFFGEHVVWNDAFSPVHFTQLIFAGEELTATTTTYATVTWRGAFGGVAPTNASHRVRICDFYQMGKDEGGGDSGDVRIQTNYMMLDVADLLRASGRRVLPRASHLPDDGLFLPPRAMDGVPAPLSLFTPPESREASRAVVLELLRREWGLVEPASAGGTGSATGTSSVGSNRVQVDGTFVPSRELWHEDKMIFYGPSGIGTATGYDEYRTHVLGLIGGAFANRRFELDVLACEGAICGAHGKLHATHVGCYLGALPTERAADTTISMRLGLHWHVMDGKALDGYMMHDAPALLRDALGGADLFERAMSAEPLPPSCPAPPPTAPLELSAMPKVVAPHTPTDFLAAVALVLLGAISTLAAMHVVSRRFVRWAVGGANKESSQQPLAAPLLG